jgi:hypothetical protein
MKYYNFETMILSLKIELKNFLDKSSFVLAYEISKNGIYYHFEILTDAAGATAINNFIDSLAYREV